ncbi:MAG: phosphopantetheine-binding protein [Burkholderiales bacterium]|nr:phosphopantetheine-binding protein [Burkholderiales bacterium]
MNREQLRAIVLEELARIAPELEPAALRADRPLREQVDLDSMDWLNFLIALHERLGVEIPEADYAKLGTLEQTLDYLAAKSGG